MKSTPSADSRVFLLTVRAPRQRPRTYRFDEERVSVGRGNDVSLDVRHTTISRRQFHVRRREVSAGGFAFEMLPEADTTNPTHIAGKPAGSHLLRDGDVISVGPVRFRFQMESRGVAASDSSRRRAVLLLGGGLAMTGLLFLAGPGGARPRRASAPREVVVFHPAAAERCADPAVCRLRALEAHALGQRHEARLGASPDACYRAVQEYRRAESLLRAGGLASTTIPDLGANERRLREQCTQEVGDALFRLRRAQQAGDTERTRGEADLLVRMIPEVNHPLRRKVQGVKDLLPPGGKR